MNIPDKVLKVINTFYKPREGFPGTFYIREGAEVIPNLPSYSPLNGSKIEKGSFYQTTGIHNYQDHIIVELDVHAFIFEPSDSYEKVKIEKVIRQVDIFSWDKDGKVKLKVEFPGSNGEVNYTIEGEAIVFMEGQIVIDFAPDLLVCPPFLIPDSDWSDKIDVCAFHLIHTDFINNDEVDSYNYNFVNFLDENNNTLGTKILFAPYLSSSSNSKAWD